MGNEGQIESDINSEREEEILSYKYFNHDLVVANFLLGLRENFNIITEVISFVSKKIHELICLEQKIHAFTTSQTSLKWNTCYKAIYQNQKFQCK